MNFSDAIKFTTFPSGSSSFLPCVWLHFQPARRHESLDDYFGTVSDVEKGLTSGSRGAACAFWVSSVSSGNRVAFHWILELFPDDLEVPVTRRSFHSQISSVTSRLWSSRPPA